jgi:hypothetical protein
MIGIDSTHSTTSGFTSIPMAIGMDLNNNPNSICRLIFPACWASNMSSIKICRHGFEDEESEKKDLGCLTWSLYQPAFSLIEIY